MKCSSCSNKKSYYNFKGIKAEFCGMCRKPNMINTYSKKCVKCLDKLPSFNHKGLRPKFCADCKEIDMISVVNKVCSICNIRRASFSKDSDIPDICKRCCVKKYKKPEIISKFSNKVAKKCIQCEIHLARYNIPNEKNKAIYCKKCVQTKENKEDFIEVRKMINLCISCEKTKATIGEFGIIKYCRPCADIINPELKDIRNKKCHSCNLRRVNPKYDNSCATCYHLSA